MSGLLLILLLAPGACAWQAQARTAPAAGDRAGTQAGAARRPAASPTPQAPSTTPPAATTAPPAKSTAPPVPNTSQQAPSAAPPAAAATTPPAASAARPGERAVEDCGCEGQPLPEVLAVVNGARITGKEIEAQTGERVRVLQQQVTEARKRELDLQINSKLLEAEAKRRGLTGVKLLEAEVISKAKEPTEAEALAFYEQNRARIGAEFKDVKGDILGYLRQEREREEAQKFAGRLRAAADVRVLAGSVTPPKAAAERARVLATVRGERITSEDIENSLRPLIYSVQEQVYALRQRELELRINDALLEQEARKRKVTTNALLETEVASKIKQVTEEEARVFYEQNKARLGAEFAPVRDRIIQYLQERAVREAQLAFATQLRRAASVQTFLARPEPPVYEIATDDQPVLGNTAAPVTIVEFTDYQCPSCAAAQPLVEQLVRESGGRVRLVVRDFPLEQHAEGFKAAEAAEAAREQGKYWEYVALLMRNQTQLGVARLKEYAARLSLDRAKFDAALDSGKFSDKVQRDIRDGLRLGVHTTPTIFVNGRMVSDPTPEQLKAALDAALRASAAK